MKKFMITILGVLFFGVSLFGSGILTPEPSVAQASGVKAITLGDAKKMHDEGVVFVDVRGKVSYKKQRITGAKHTQYKGKGGNKNKIPEFDNSKDKFKTKTLPSDKNAKVVVYCTSKKCWLSYKAAYVMSNQLGYTNVFWMRDGIMAWEKAGYPVE
ncbi:MAG: rhodanese-like domain-containing protein [Campylobacterota bacterium]|nr:rhodanese-like domain-containing protein [Campylobacterota bacterium]